MKKKNLIVIMTDEQRHDSMGFMGNPVLKTPNIDRLAKEGTVFTNAHTVTMLCVPSRTSFYMGQYPSKTGCITNNPMHHIRLHNHSLIELLKNNGYTTGLAGKNHAFHDEYMEKWFDYREEYGHWGKEHGELTGSDKKVSAYRHTEKRPGFQNKQGLVMEGLLAEAEPFKEEECMTHRIAQDGMRFVEQNRDKPFFLYYSFPSPHWPSMVCEPYWSMYKPGDIKELEGSDINWDGHPFKHFVQSQALGCDKYTTEQRKKVLATYYAQITFIDKAVGMMLDKLKELKLEDDTIVIFTSDHGNFAGRYGLTGKTSGFYDALIRIPLIIKIPGTKNGSTLEANVSNIDVMPTLLEVMDIPVPENTVQGQPFTGVLNGIKKQHREELYAEVGNSIPPPPAIPKENYAEYNRKRNSENAFWFIEYTTNGRSAAIKSGDWKYCYNTGDLEELYNMKDDPLELKNLADDPKSLKVKDRMKALLLEKTLSASISEKLPI